MTAHNLADLYDLPPLDLADVQADLARALTAQAPDTGGPGRHSCWFTTINADGSPHLTGIGPLWSDGSFWICTGTGTRKGRNLAREPRCALSVSTDLYDLTAEGSATLVTDPAVAASGTELTAPFSAPSAGPGPWAVYQMTVTSMHALGAGGPGGATRWSL